MRVMKVFLFACLIVSFCSLHADMLKNRNNGTIVTVGRLQKADVQTIYWIRCDGTGEEFTPRKDYLYKPGTNDCRSGHTAIDPNRGQNNDEGWIDVPVTEKTKR